MAFDRRIERVQKGVYVASRAGRPRSIKAHVGARPELVFSTGPRSSCEAHRLPRKGDAGVSARVKGGEDGGRPSRRLSLPARAEQRRERCGA